MDEQPTKRPDETQDVLIELHDDDIVHVAGAQGHMIDPDGATVP